MQTTIDKINLKHNQSIDITNFISYKDTEAHNKRMSYNEFVTSLQKPLETSKKSTNGGFVGGWVEGKRENKNVKTRSLITLDIDEGNEDVDVWGNVKSYSNFSCVMYSTHNSTLESPRYRLIIPLKYPIAPGEYKPITKFIADLLNIKVDSNSFTVSQLMNYPTCENINNYEFYYRDLPFFDNKSIPKEKLQEEKKSPIAVGKEGKLKEGLKKSPSLTDEEVFKIASNSSNSEKFKMLYEGDFSSYKSQSQADQALCNIISFFTQDTKQIDRMFTDSGFYRDKWDRPDYKTDTINKAIEGLNATFQKQEFELHVNQSSDVPKLNMTDKGAVKKLLYNLKEILRCDPSLKEIGFNEFTQEVTINKEPITDGVISKVRYEVDSKYQITFTKDDVIDMLGLLARERNSYHPIKEIIEARMWDKTSRAESIFIDYLGADDNEYTRSITKKWLAGAIARIYEPGIKMEIVPVLQGGQGIGKSTMAAILGKGFFVDSLASLGNTKDDYQLLIGSWIVELSELSSLGSTKVEKMKGFISAKFDKIRLPYGKVTQNYNRTCVFIGTTNSTQFLNDLTGNRRFFPIPLENDSTLDVFNIDDDTIQQIWAEAYHLYKQGEKLFLDKEDEEVAELYRDEAMEENLFFKEIEDYLNMKVSKDWNNLDPISKKGHYGSYRHQGNRKGTEHIDRTTAKEIAYTLNVDSTNFYSQSQMKKINLYMSSLNDWEKKSVRINGKPEQGYKKI